MCFSSFFSSNRGPTRTGFFVSHPLHLMSITVYEWEKSRRDFLTYFTRDHKKQHNSLNIKKKIAKNFNNSGSTLVDILIEMTFYKQVIKIKGSASFLPKKMLFKKESTKYINIQKHYFDYLIFSS